jgi:hypothetical protein
VTWAGTAPGMRGRGRRVAALALRCSLSAVLSIGGAADDECADDSQTWNGECSLLGSWSAEIKVSRAEPVNGAGCYNLPVAPTSPLRRLESLRVAGPTAPLECMTACLAFDVDAVYFAVSNRTRGCFCQRNHGGHGDPRPQLMAAHPLMCAQTCEKRPDTRGDCAALLASGAYHCGSTFCGDPARCELPGLCDTSCKSCLRNVSRQPAAPIVPVELYEILHVAASYIEMPELFSNTATAPCRIESTAVNCPHIELKRRAISAGEACCACGGGDVNGFGGCVDRPVNWKDNRGRSCLDYSRGNPSLGISNMCSEYGLRDGLGSFASDDNTSLAATITAPGGQETLLWAIQDNAASLSVMAGKSRFMSEEEGFVVDQAEAKISLVALNNA